MRVLALAVLAVSVAAVVFAGLAARWSYFGSDRTFPRNLLRVTAGGVAGVITGLILLAIAGR
jgi:hypothetical protein